MDFSIFIMERHEIYLHTNTENNKVYVGLTKHNMMRRWRGHCKDAIRALKKENMTYFQNAIIKNAEDIWKHEVLEVVNSREEANIAERKWIAHYKSNDAKFGYNLNEGGNVSQSPQSELTKKKISEACKKNLLINPGRIEAQRASLIEYYKNNVSTSLGKIHTAETRKKFSDAKKGKHTGAISKEALLEAAKGCISKVEVGIKLNCTKNNICYLSKSYNIKKEIDDLLKYNKSLLISKEILEECYNRLKSITKVAKELHHGKTTIVKYLKKFNIERIK